MTQITIESTKSPSASKHYTDDVVNAAIARLGQNRELAQDEDLSKLYRQGHLKGVADGENFIVYAPDQRTANEVLNEAIRFRKSLSQQLLGGELPKWSAPLVIAVFPNEKPSDERGAGGSTVYDITPGEPRFYGSILSGPRQRIMDSVLPHELTHAILATHFSGRQVPRWADEGTCTTVEDSSQTRWHESNLIKSLNQDRCHQLGKLFSMREYPAEDPIPEHLKPKNLPPGSPPPKVEQPNLLAFYSQGHSVVKYLINLGENIERTENDGVRLTGQQRFVKFLDRGAGGDWQGAVKQYYNFDSLDALQTAWNRSVGGKQIPLSTEPLRPATSLASNTGSIPWSSDGSVILPPRPAQTGSSNPIYQEAPRPFISSVTVSPVGGSATRPLPAGNNSEGVYANNSSGSSSTIIRPAPNGPQTGSPALSGPNPLIRPVPAGAVQPMPDPKPGHVYGSLD